MTSTLGGNGSCVKPLVCVLKVIIRNKNTNKIKNSIVTSTLGGVKRLVF